MAEDIQAGERLALTLAGSLILHLALLFAVRVQAPPGVQPSLNVIQARIVERHAVVAPQPADQPAPVESLELRVDEAIPAVAQSASVETAAAPPQTAAAEASASAAPSESSANLPSVTVPLIEDPTYYPAPQVDVHPVALQPVMPSYPGKAVNSRVSGSVVLVLLLDEGGKVQDETVEEADPPGYFEDSALAAFKDARFSPAQRNGKVVKSKVRIKVTYDLTDGPDTLPAGKVK